MPEKPPEPALDEMAEDGRNLREGLAAEVKQDLAKAKGEGSPKRPWWKFWART